jgi:3-hydroxyacyl-[acyl-carrier-protein] dehydratase
VKFNLIDRITEIEKGARITAIKSLSLAEEYLADHFPENPVMPGVLMLEALVQAGAYLVRASKDFSPSVVIMTEVRNVKYGQFIAPGDRLQIEVNLLNLEDDKATCRGRGILSDQTVVSAHFILSLVNLEDENPLLRKNDQAIREAAREKFVLLGGQHLLEGNEP